MLLVAFGNRARHGKDSAARAIVEHYKHRAQAMEMYYGDAPRPPKVQIFKFAEALYKECRELHGMKDKDAPLLQKVGALRRQENPYYWINPILGKMNKAKPDIALITDVRYKNEAECIKEWGGFLINVTRLNDDGTPFVANDRPSDHPSETELDDYKWDYRIVTHTGEEALAGDLAVTIVEYLRGIRAQG